MAVEVDVVSEIYEDMYRDTAARCWGVYHQIIFKKTYNHPATHQTGVVGLMEIPYNPTAKSVLNVTP
jgi:hypothetical protein